MNIFSRKEPAPPSPHGLKWYYRDGTFMTDDTITWAKWLEDQYRRGIDFHVADTYIGRWRVSTRYMDGMDLSVIQLAFLEPVPMLFEIMIFDYLSPCATPWHKGEDAEEITRCQMRYASEVEAMFQDSYIVGILRTAYELPRGADYHGHAHALDGGGFLLRITDIHDRTIAAWEVDWHNYRPSSAGHRMIEYGYSVLPAAHHDPRRCAGWEPTEYGWRAPLYRLPEGKTS